MTVLPGNWKKLTDEELKSIARAWGSDKELEEFGEAARLRVRTGQLPPGADFKSASSEWPGGERPTIESLEKACLGY